LAGEWTFEGRPRTVPDTWHGDDAGGPDGRGFGTYHLTVLVPPGSPPLALRWGTAATALALRVNGVEVARVGNPDPDRRRAASAYAPGTVRLAQADRLEIEATVSNHDYRVGGLWWAPSLGPAPQVERAQWADEVGSLGLAAALGVIAVTILLLFAYRPSEISFLHLGVFALLIALRALVTGEYLMVRLVPGLPFDVLIRMEYLTAYLPLPSATLFFARYFPGFLPVWLRRTLTWPSWALAALALVLPLDLMTRSIPIFYPIAIPSLAVGASLLLIRARAEGQDLLVIGVAVLAGAGLADMTSAALLSTTGSLVPWGLGLFVALQATTQARGFLKAFDTNAALLVEKELLVKEIHHRVRNSLQVVASLVSLQAHRMADPGQKEIFHALRRRITAIALVHEKLHGKQIGEKPELGAYLEELVRLQFPQDGLGSGRISWEFRSPPLEAEVDACVDAGLIVTELVSNSRKHGAGLEGRIAVSAAVEGERLILEVGDEGPGFPEGFSPDGSEGLGFRLIAALLGRNDGRLEVAPGPGGRVRVDLRKPG